MSCTVFKFTIGTTGASMAHMDYISRQTAVLDNEDGVLMRNIPESVKEARDYRELRENLACYAWAREKSEIARFKDKGQVRTHYRVMASFEKDTPTERIKQMMDEWLEKKLPTARACGFIHRDTDHVHVHIWVDARQISGEKIHLGSASYKSLDKEWNTIYSREMGRPEHEYLDRIETNRQERILKRAMTQMLVMERDEESGLEPSRKMYVNREQRNMGVQKIDQETTRGNQRQTTNLIERINEREPRTKTATRGNSRGERVQPGLINMARGGITEVRQQNSNVREREQQEHRPSNIEIKRDTKVEQPNRATGTRETTVESTRAMVDATNRELSKAIQGTQQAVKSCEGLQRAYDQAVERGVLAQEPGREQSNDGRDYDYNDRDDYDEPSR